jgi:hypothetical protein
MIYSSTTVKDNQNFCLHQKQV